LLPSKEPQERIATLDEIDTCISTSPNPKFVEFAQEFRNSFRPGDIIVEFCSDVDSWRIGMGSAGFLLRRNGADVALLVLRMN
jgi:hypothetical protein